MKLPKPKLKKVKETPAIAKPSESAKPPSVHPKNGIKLRFPNLVSFFSGQHAVAGIAISENNIYSVVLNNFRGAQPTVVSSQQVALPQGTFVEGKLNKPQDLVAALIKLRSKAKTPFCIFSLPGSEWWMRLFFFPASLTNVQFEDSMQFHLSLDLPWDPKEAYADWEEIDADEADKRSALLVAAKISAITPYLDVLERAGWTTLAIEPASLSIIRAIAHFEADVPAIVLGYDGTILEEMIVWKGKMHFGRVVSLPAQESVFKSDEKYNLSTKPAVSVVEPLGTSPAKGLDVYMAVELKRLMAYVQTEPLGMPKPTHLFFVGPFSQTHINKLAEVARNYGLTEKVFAASSLPWGVALRGLIPRDKDNLISLMPVGTEESYTRKRAALFFEFALNFSFLVVLILAVSFAGAWFFVRNEKQKSIERLARIKGNTTQIQATIEGLQEFTDASALAISVAQATPHWDGIYGKILDAQVPGITIYKITLNVSGAVKIQGKTEKPSNLLAFRDALQNKNLGQNIVIPANLFESGGTGDFVLVFNLPDTKEPFNP
ncbi:MAG: hypothetical protein A3A80_00070 [Candidatus Terrybacteria bacterium RIFCSPLOWO2_01_FULL_44_24]|uniref:Uncharacterized protein n=1 Tax=Candidatus Terrybacteria bacterium RIFCSPHIGHO2_01_FULL_43_35 TaxID=1802361 RepID=A0A1G2PG29_9BACT|nr:MAG: hypothetical protein A2828_03455 [Candidatus Terrybacteria bacterium RIFCSPHIGHO2_01_FULL_43_35]OHA50462.1 MAG: hypothetical protein A3B75_00925 [Candidatus Terrybacteria bacterium RIFCSPHIGHO2_02_FULL_43_14]OHA51080.1 MAG: hypothetical protein A3A80_00070 [Candidatus Terrybacteria bacterium RIFCSPLOWO2_01_FULL_44_24]